MPVTAIIPAPCALRMPPPSTGLVPNGVGNGLIVNSQMNPAIELMMTKSAMKMTMWLSTGALCTGLKTIRSIA